MLGDQIIKRIEFLHQHYFIHRDIKPDNFMVGLNRKQHVIHLIDFGLSKRYLNKGNHMPYREGK